MKRFAAAAGIALKIALALAVTAGAARAQRLPGLPGGRPSRQPVARDTTKDSTGVHWPAPDTSAQKLLNLTGYSITRYQGDTAIFNNQTQSLDLLAAPNHKVAVQRDSQLVVSDSGIFYRQGTHDVLTGGRYLLSDPTSGQADVHGLGRVTYSLNEKSARVTNASLPVAYGETWYLRFNVGRVDFDTSATKTPVAWMGGLAMTSCSDSVPDYYFAVKNAKRVGGTIAGAPAVLYIRDIPVMWLPFIFSDTRGGRHSGILPPQFGLGDIVRNSPSYRRHVDRLGYYWATSDYADFATWLDWRSSAGATATDPGWVRFNGDWNYKWLNEFLGGRVGANYTVRGDGQKNLGVTWTHQQEFGHDSHLSTSVNYVTNTTVQRQNTFNPYAAIATIASMISYTSKLGPASLSLGATQKQYPGRQQLERTFPTLSLTSTPLSLGKWLTWTPSFSYNASDVLHMDQPGPGQYTLVTDAAGHVDSTLSKSRSSSTSSTSFDTPLQIFGWKLSNSFHVDQQRNNFPEEHQLYDVETGNVIGDRIFAATYKTSVDWTPQFSLPGVAQNKFNLTPSFGLANVDPGPFWVETERTNGQFVHQAKRLTFGLGASPTLFHLFPGFGPFERIRHSITPQISYSYAPAATVSDAYLNALGETRKGYLGDLQQSAVSVGLTQNFEAKVRPKNDTSQNATADKIKLLSLSFTPLTFDFERMKAARARGLSPWRGLTSDSWGYSLNSDLLPGFDFSANYSLFQGDVISDTAVFKPWLQSVSANLNFSRTQNPFVVLSRLFGKAAPEPNKAPSPGVEGVQPNPDQAIEQQLAAMPVAGSAMGGDRFIVPTTQGWTASVSFSRSSPRPPVGSNVIDFDPTARCQQIAAGDPFILDACLQQQRAQPTTDTPVMPTTAGGPAYRIPPTTSINGNFGFGLTPNWSAHWTTTYDVEHHQFASHVVQLQREIHDWRALFGFTQSPNGNFAFTFTIALKADPDIKFDYNKANVRNGASGF